MSSRNVYLNAPERKQALVLYGSLMRVKGLWETGEKDSAKLAQAGREEIKREPAVRLDYFELVDAGTLDPVRETAEGTLVAVAAWVGATRLIDNILLGM